jgi:uncharacterized protein
MDISGSYTLYAPRERVWAALLDPDMLKQTVPGCERLDKESEDTFLLRLNIGVASVKGIYDGTLRLSDLHPPERYRMTVDGRGARGVLHGDGTLSLEARDPNTTVVSYSGQAQLGGPIAGVGMRVANGAANMLIKGYFSRLADLLAERAPVAASASAAADVLPEEVVDSPLEGPPPVTAAASAAQARVATSTASTAPPAPGAVNLPERGPLMRLVRRAGLSDGSIESERRWARGIIGGFLVIAAVIVLIAVLAARSPRRERL